LLGAAATARCSFAGGSLPLCSAESRIDWGFTEISPRSDFRTPARCRAATSPNASAAPTPPSPTRPTRSASRSSRRTGGLAVQGRYPQAGTPPKPERLDHRRTTLPPPARRPRYASSRTLRLPVKSVSSTSGTSMPSVRAGPLHSGPALRPTIASGKWEGSTPFPIRLLSIGRSYFLYFKSLFIGQIHEENRNHQQRSAHAFWP